MSDRVMPSGQRWDGLVARDGAHQHNAVTNNYATHEGAQAGSNGQTERAWEDALLGWLTFAEIEDRREQIKEAHKETFRWIFDMDDSTGFANWLQTGVGIYWIKGKPASGKSTLMKFITREARVRPLLQIWAAKAPLVIGSFYFWAAGTRMQRSLVGLYRTLLFQMLKTDDRLCRLAFPDWQHKFVDVEPTLEMLSTATARLLASKSLTTNFFLIIDGLEEYERDSIGNTELAELMLSLAASSKIKLLLSSRPETAFEIAFRKCSSLRLETLTMPDILSYVESTLWSNPSVRSISALEKSGVDDIASFVVENAKGVFLWVVLVLKIALDGINSFESLPVIRHRVMLLPLELDALFNHIITHRIAQRHRQEAFRCLLIALAWGTREFGRHSWSPFLFSMLIATARQASNYQKACELANTSETQVIHIVIEFENCLADRCQGLLERCGVHPFSSPAGFLHRTLLDYLNETEGVKSFLESAVGDTFDVHTAIMAGLACWIWNKGLRLNNEFVQAFFRFNALAERSTGQSRGELIAAFDRGMLKRHHHHDETSKRSLPTHQHWTNYALHFEYLPIKNNLVACAIYTGSTLYAQEAIQKGGISKEELSVPLCMTAYPAYFETHGEGEYPEVLDINIAAATLLLENGADPAYTHMGICSWTLVLRDILACVVWASDGTNMRQSHVDLTHWFRPRTSDHVSRTLHLLFLFAQYAPDLATCSAMRVRQYTASDVLQEVVLKGMCCSSSRVQDCQCRRAQTWKILATQVLRLLEDYRQDTLETAAVERKSLKAWYLRKMIAR